MTTSKSKMHTLRKETGEHTEAMFIFSVATDTGGSGFSGDIFEPKLVRPQHTANIIYVC